MEKQNKKRKFRLMDLLIILVFLAGLCILLYPQVSDFINRIQVAHALGDYQRAVREITPEDYTAVFEKARDYNRRLKKIRILSALQI